MKKTKVEKVTTESTEVVKATTRDELVEAGVVVAKHTPDIHPNQLKAFQNAGMFI